MSSIERIGQSIKSIEAHYEKFDDVAFNNGGVDEYTVTIHKKLLKEVMGLFKAIAEFPDLLSSEFSTNQMNEIAGLAENLAGNQYNGSILNEDGYRALISRMRVVFGEKEALQYESEKDKLRELMVKVEEILKKEEFVSSMKVDIEGIRDRLDIILNSQLQAQQGLAEVQKKNVKAEEVLNSVNTKYKEIEEKRSGIVKLFSEIVQNQKNLEKLETQNTEFSERLEKEDAEYSEKRGEMVKTAESMLGLANAAELAAAFNQRIEKAKEKRRWPWILGAIVFIMVTMGIAAALYYFNKEDEITLTGTLARMSITAVPLLAAWFCGAQYLKLERTLEDYQYKKALAQSMPAFMKQLGEGNEEYRAYLFLVFQQMLQDPLRKQHDVPSPLKDLFDKIFEKSPKDTTPKD